MRFERHQSIRMGGWRNFNSRMDGNEFCSNLNAHGVGTGAVSSCWLHRDEPSRCIACMNSSEAMILRRDTLGRVVFALQRQIELLCQPARNQILHFRPPFSPSVAPSLLHLWNPPPPVSTASPLTSPDPHQRSPHESHSRRRSEYPRQ
jgi:hypothetical protein